MPDESSKMVSYEITKGSNVESIVMTTSGTLFARIEQKVWQFMFDQNVDNWVTGDEVDTRLTG